MTLPAVQVRTLGQAELATALERVAQLRITVFRDWPYLYDGTLAYELDYLTPYRNNPRACIVGAFAGDALVGAATGTPMEDHAAEFAAPFAQTGFDLSDIFYCAESVLLPGYRGQGVGHAFFEQREAQARQLGRSHVAFCGVVRPDGHPARPADARPLDPFWRARGYRPLPGVVAQFGWKDIGQDTETLKPLQFWIRTL